MKKKLISFVFIITSFIIIFNVYNKIMFDINEQVKVNGYYQNNSSFKRDESCVLKIEKINLENLVIKAEDDYKNLDDGLVYYKHLIPNDKIVIFGHSGMGIGTYFNRLESLKKNDLAYLYIKDIIYVYVVYGTYLVDEENLFILKEEENSGKLLLVTCDKKDKRKRLVVELRLKSTKNP